MPAELPGSRWDTGNISCHRVQDVSIAVTSCLQGEIFAAEGYAKVTGDVGVCIATSGPGATNLVTGLADALLDSVPLVAITGQVSINTFVVLACVFLNCLLCACFDIATTLSPLPCRCRGA
jgi:Thiamine pyrophosphate enzyme, N-terminal TPP binding domain